MQKREKILLAAVVGIGAFFGLGLGVDRYLLQPAAELDRLINARHAELADLRDMQWEATRAVETMEAIAQQTYADTADRATAVSGERIAALLREARLAPADFTRTPLAPRRLRGAVEVGWSVRGRGPLDRVVDLLYLLAAEPVVHRIDALSLTAGDRPGQVNVQFRFVTLVVDAVAPPLERQPLEPRFTLAEGPRELYAGITTRDLFRPYVPRPPERERPRQREHRPEPQAPSSPPPPPPPGPETFRVVSLSQWGGQAEVHVLDTNQNRMRRYTPGDELADGRVVMIDYRALPLPNNPALQSASRVIVEIGDAYWAIERGHTLADKYRLEGDRLPEELRAGEGQQEAAALVGTGRESQVDDIR